MIENVDQQGNQRQENMDLAGFYYNNAKIDYDQLKERVSVLEEDNEILNTAQNQEKQFENVNENNIIQSAKKMSLEITSLKNQKEELVTKILNLTTSLANQKKEHELALANQKKDHEHKIKILISVLEHQNQEIDTLKQKHSNLVKWVSSKEKYKTLINNHVEEEKENKRILKTNETNVSLKRTKLNDSNFEIF